MGSWTRKSAATSSDSFALGRSGASRGSYLRVTVLRRQSGRRGMWSNGRCRGTVLDQSWIWRRSRRRPPPLDPACEGASCERSSYLGGGTVRSQKRPVRRYLAACVRPQRAPSLSPTMWGKERCESGRIGLTANELTWETGSEGSNPSLSATDETDEHVPLSATVTTFLCAEGRLEM